MASSFNAFTANYDGLANRIITEIKLSQVFDPRNPPIPLPPAITTTALWDTGATKSVITPSVAKDLGVVAVNKTTMISAHGSAECNVYLVNLYLPNKVALPGVLVCECADTAHFGVIIGMDVICRGDFSITNVNGKTSVSFRIPSIAAIDYVQEAQDSDTEQLRKVIIPHVGRNDPCPCKSGKKYKKCHGS